jgi:hypothetical protein
MSAPRLFAARLLTLPIVILASCAESSDSGGGPSSLVALTEEPAGSNCAAGGTKISTGADMNGNGKLDDSEVTDSSFVCSGVAGGATADGGNAGAGSLVDVVNEPSGANCANGGVRIASGSDEDGDGVLDSGEVKTTKYVCNGASGDAGSDPMVVTSYNVSNGNVGSNTTATVQQLSIAAPGPGKVIALITADLFCASPALDLGYDCNASGVTAGTWTLTTNASAAANTGDYDYFYLSQNSTENVARHSVFTVASAQNVTVYVRARTDTAGAYAFFRSSLTLLFIPD